MKKHQVFNCDCEESYDAVVVGSGYGGSVAACRMSIAGMKVCLMERGRKWEAEDFPTESFKMMSAVRIQNANLNFGVGPKDALLQVHLDGDSVAAVACGLGGGSLINAGVMRATPVRARKNPKWPLEWESDWEICQASASAMLRTESAPVKFSSNQIMKHVVEEDIEDAGLSSIKLSVNFDKKDSAQSVKPPEEMGRCLACGNCLSGCPYNAKKSTDKNYILTAIQAGCTVKTKCAVQYVVQHLEDPRKEESGTGKEKRRWLVFLNETDYVMADFVIVSAGVFGTTDILFQSRKRGLKLSEKLGDGLSCNGNVVAYVAGSPAPLNSLGLDKKELLKIPFEERPGPSITSFFTSSKGFTIQSAVLPAAYSGLFFKSMVTYKRPNGYGFLHGILDRIKSVVSAKSSNGMVLCSMGYDESDGKIYMASGTNKLRFMSPHDPLLPRVIEAFQKIAAKLGGFLFMSKYRSSAVHLLGGCNASSSHLDGVCNPSGQVFDLKTNNSVHPGLYVSDASLIPCSVGTNPSLTIATVAEHISKHIVNEALRFKSQRDAFLHRGHTSKEYSCSKKISNECSTIYPVSFKETMRGYIGGMPCTAHLTMNMRFSKQNVFDETTGVTERSDNLLRGKVGGHIVFKALEKHNLYIIDGQVDLCEVDHSTPYTQNMRYRLLLATSSGSRYFLEGTKILNPYLIGMYCWRESTTMLVTLKKIPTKNSAEEMETLQGELVISFVELVKSLISLQGYRRGQFLSQLIQSLYVTYILQVPRATQDFSTSECSQKPYPSSTLLHIKTEDGFNITCRQWKADIGVKKFNPVLLVNGYATESFWLPTEENDLVRALFNQGHDTWLLQSRLHPSHPSNNFTLEDIGKYDIPSAICKIQEAHGSSTKVHIIAHCVGGLVVHIAIMGGYVSASSIASLTCTNSSMFFKLTTSARVKMRLPLIPVSMALLGKNKIVTLCDSLQASLRHNLLKSIARVIPRYERCTSDQCEIFSGIFGNPFWHKNLTTTAHDFIIKETLPILPLASFPHLRKICNTGFIVDSKGENSFLIHPERMTVSTLYMSGGRTLLVTPETSFLANNYMKLHQPSFQHKRVVVEGFGHSDLLVGEKSHQTVFPHILEHIILCEQGKDFKQHKKYTKESLGWAGDELVKLGGSGDSYLHSVTTVLLVILFIFYILNIMK